MRASRQSGSTDCGLPGVGMLAYGVHMCHFYRDRAELVAALVPYFAAGLRNNERCIWITAAPLPVEEAKAELRKAYVDVDQALDRGALVIKDYAEWYVAAGELKGSAVAGLWIEQEQRALAEGYSGLRITGNTSFLTPGSWGGFMDYEAGLGAALRGHRIVTLCSYSHGHCSALQVAEVLRYHDSSTSRPNGGWKIVTSYQP